MNASTVHERPAHESPVPRSAARSMRQAFVETVDRLLGEDPRLALVLADISVRLFAERGTLERHPDRTINVGIREQAMIGVAAGLALEGFRPIVHSYAPFLVERPFEQLKLDLSHQGVGAVLVSVGGTFDTAAEGRTHQAPGDVALLRTLPDWTIAAPGHADETERLLRHAAVAGSGSVYLRLGERGNRQARPIEPGRLLPVRRGRPEAPTVVAVGPMLDPVLDALDALAEVDASVLYATTVHPLDGETLRAVAATDVVVVEPWLEGTSVAAIAAALVDRPRRLLAIGVPAVEHRRYGSAAEHEAAFGLDPRSLRQRITAFLGSAA